MGGMRTAGRDVRDDDRELLEWLVDLAGADRSHYREIRALAWALRVERSHSSESPTIFA